MSISVSNFNDILKEAYTRYENRSAEEYRAYMDGITDLLNLIVLTDEVKKIRDRNKDPNEI